MAFFVLKGQSIMKVEIEPQTLRYQPKEIRETKRPTIAYEHPNALTYLKSMKENIIRFANKKSLYTQHDEYIKKRIYG